MSLSRRDTGSTRVIPVTQPIKQASTAPKRTMAVTDSIMLSCP